MKADFTQNSIRYSLCVAPVGRNEPLVAPDKGAKVWANAAQKQKLTGGLDVEKTGPRVTEHTEPGKRRPKVPWSTPRPIPAEHFLESAPLD